MPEQLPPSVAPSILSKLAAIVGDRAVLHKPEELMVYECDSLTLEKNLPQCVAFPQSAEQVAALVKLCVQERIPYVARGAGTGISGGANPARGGLVIHLSRMCRILEIDPENRYAVVEPGVVNTELSRKCAPHRLHFAPDPSSQTVSTIGGNVAENAGGPHCFKYGITINHVVALELVLPDGEIVHLGGRAPGQPGYDLVALEVGAEGTLGIATKIGVRLTPIPEAVRTLLVTFPSLESAAAAVNEIVSSSIVPSAIEMMDQRTIKVIEESDFRAGFPTDAAAVLLLELDGFKAGIAADSVTVTKLCEKNDALSVTQGDDEEQRKKLWAARKCTFGIMGRVNTDLYVLDGTVPRSKLPEALTRVQEIGGRYGLQFTNVFHAGDGNLHPLVAFDGRNGEEVRKITDAGEEIMKACLDLGGTLSGEHGIGLEKKRFMPLFYSPDDLDIMRQVKAAIDPDHLCNPGKIFPDGIPPKDPASNGSTHSSTGSLTDQIAEQFGSDVLVPETHEFAIDGIVPKAVVRPKDEAQLAKILRFATDRRLKVAPLGGGTHRTFGNRLRSLDLVIQLTNLNRVLSYEPEDQIITVQAGAGIDAVKATILEHLQWLPLNPPSAPGSTVGGMLATGLPTATRDCVGTLRDMVVGMKIALPDGRLVKSGGRVIKNVSGYDLHRLMVGGLGTLGVIVEASLRVQFLPPAIRSILCSFKTLDQALNFCHLVQAAPLAPLAMELTNEPARTHMGIRLSENLQGGEFAVSIRFGETEQAVSWQILQASNMATDNACVGLRVGEGTPEVQLWERMVRYSGTEERTRIRIGTQPSAIGRLAHEILQLGIPGEAGLSLRPMSGETLVEFENTEDLRVPREALRKLSQTARDIRATFSIERTPDELKEEFDCLGHPNESLSLMRRVKKAFDPNQTLNPGRHAARI